MELNPRILSTIIGEGESEILAAINKFCEPDEKSRSKAEGGRKLIKEGEYLYHVVNGQEYDKIRNNEERREYWRNQKRKARNGDGGNESAEVKKPTQAARQSHDPIMPANLQSATFRRAWAEWLEHLRQKRKPPTAIAMQKQLKKLSEMGELRGIAALENSITNSWTGVFEPSASTTLKKPAVYNAI